jgi:hypothetical protein
VRTQIEKRYTHTGGHQIETRERRQAQNYCLPQLSMQASGGERARETDRERERGGGEEGEEWLVFRLQEMKYSIKMNTTKPVMNPTSHHTTSQKKRSYS